MRHRNTAPVQQQVFYFQRQQAPIWDIVRQAVLNFLISQRVPGRIMKIQRIAGMRDAIREWARADDIRRAQDVPSAHPPRLSDADPRRGMAQERTGKAGDIFADELDQLGYLPPAFPLLDRRASCRERV